MAELVFHRCRRLAVILFEVSLVVLSNYFAFLLRFDGDVDPYYVVIFKNTLPIVVLIRGLMFIPFRLYEGLWRYTSLWDLRNIIAAILSSTLVIAVTVTAVIPGGPGFPRYPHSILLIDALLLLVLMSGIRLSRRIYRETWGARREKGVLIYGAGDAGEMIVREMKNNSFYKMDPIGFIDDDAKKVGHRIHGVPVLGTRKDLKMVMSRTKIQEIVIAMPKAGALELRQVIKALEPFKVPIRTLPNLRNLLDGKVTVSQIRNLALEDLLQRAPIGLDPAPVRGLIEGKRIVVTGAGGSIGTELCRQLLRMCPDTLIMLERHEHSIYTLQRDLERDAHSRLVSKITDVTDRQAVRQIFTEYMPQIVFHAAAHKHVPLMEQNPCEAIKNNIGGTRVLAEEAASSAVERFILISTDKAVNPSSIMGASKRVAELLIQHQARDGTTCFNAVRFGNVLGSNGSAVPLFMEQIKVGGPVTITHPEMRRYFMLTSEAVHLVLHAATLGRTGAIYVLDMGDEFKVLDLARNLIRLSGYVPDEEIPIQFVGLRPGEKLSENLVGADETVEPSAVEKIRRVKSQELRDPKWIETQILDLEAAAAEGSIDAVVRGLARLVPTFSPSIANTMNIQARVVSNTK
jgi:FlaA1/EpsC-like NDP-sugar epimerase